MSIETMVILDMILDYTKDFDKKLTDPVWETVSLKIKKYKPFLNIDVTKFKQFKRAGRMSKFFDSEVVRESVFELEDFRHSCQLIC